MSKKNRKQNPLESAEAQQKKAREAAENAAEEIAEDAADTAEEISEDVTDAAEDAAAEVVETADAIEEDIADAAERADEALEEEAEELAGRPQVTLEEAEQMAADAIRQAEAQIEDGDIPETEEAETAKPAKSEKPKKEKKELTPEQEKYQALVKAKRRKKFKYGALATGITLVVLAAVVLVNVICSVLDSRFHWNIDLTSSGLYEIDEKTADYLHNISQDIQIAVMAEESDFNDDKRLKIVSETLDQFKAESDNHISVEYIDMTKHPEAVRTYSEHYDGEIVAGNVVVKCGDLVRVAAFDDLLRTETSVNYETYSYEYKYFFTGEQTLISAIMGVTDLNPVKGAIITKAAGSEIYYKYDSYAFARIQQLLEKNNYVMTEVDLTNDTLSPDDYEFAVLCAPLNDLTEAQITKLTDYLYNDGKYDRDLVYFGSPNQKETPNLDAFLEIWGLKLGSSVIYESNASAAQVVGSIFSQTGQLGSVPVVSVSADELNANAAETKLPIVAPLCRPIERLFDANSSRTTASLLDTADTSFAVPLDSSDFDVNNAEKKSYSVAAVATTNFTYDNVQHTSRVIAFGAPELLSEFIAGSASYANANYFVSVMNTVSGKEAVITVAEKSLNNTAVTITDAKAKMIRNIVMFIIPIIVAAIGIGVYIRRKNL